MMNEVPNDQTAAMTRWKRGDRREEVGGMAQTRRGAERSESDLR